MGKHFADPGETCEPGVLEKGSQRKVNPPYVLKTSCRLKCTLDFFYLHSMYTETRISSRHALKNNVLSLLEKVWKHPKASLRTTRG